jgi:hypothetical protein
MSTLRKVMTTALPGWRTRAAALTVGVIAVTATIATTTAQAEAPAQPTTKVVAWSQDGGKVLVAAPGVRDKSLVTPDTIIGQQDSGPVIGPDGYPDRNKLLNPTGRETVSATGGSVGPIEAVGSSHVEIPFLEYFAMYEENQSHVAWLGESPFNADSISHTDTWAVDFVGTGYVIVGAPPGSTQQNGSGSASVTWTTTVADNWYSEHHWPFVAFFPETPPQFGQLFRVQSSVTGTFQFGSSFYTTTGKARTFV